MRSKIWWILFVLGLLVFLPSDRIAAQDDDLPDLCNSLLPRYEAQNHRLVLVDWATGADVRTLATDLDDTLILGWSLDCRYLAGAVGSTSSMATVVWDAEAGVEIGRVPDAHLQPHHITWGPSNFLVVETRNGAILWNVPANAQYPLTTTFNATTMRNFSRLRWDADNGQLLANLAVGGRVVYDLAIGLEVPAAENVTHVDTGGPFPTITVGGKDYNCGESYVRSFFPYETDKVIYVDYDEVLHAIYIRLGISSPVPEVLRVVEDQVITDRFVFQGWSANCRYFAASLKRPGQRVSDTVVWDVVENRRVGVFEDAREINHLILWDTTGEALLIETRHGAYLWYLPTDTRTLLYAGVVTHPGNYPSIEVFGPLRWYPERGLLVTVPEDSPRTILVFDARTGQRVAVYGEGGEAIPEWLYVHTDDNGSIDSLTDWSQRYSWNSQVDFTRQVPQPMTPLAGESGWSRIDSSYTRWPNICGETAVRYDSAARRLIVEDAKSGTLIRVIESNLNETSGLSWSPDCRIVSGQVAQVTTGLPYDAAPFDDTRYDLRAGTRVLWDVATGARLREFNAPGDQPRFSSVGWSPRGDRALVNTADGYFIWQPATGHTAFLVYQFGQPRWRMVWGDDPAANVYWDYSRGLLLMGYQDGVRAFDMITGLERYRLTLSPDGQSCLWRPCEFSVLDDGVHVRLRGYLLDREFVGYSAPAYRWQAIWNLDTLESSFHRYEYGEPW